MTFRKQRDNCKIDRILLSFDGFADRLPKRKDLVAYR